MKCPYCKKEISDKIISKHLASKGGKASRRILSPEQAREMALISAETRKRNKERES